ncbi:MAG: hypothetical protein WC144_05390 [Sulfurimonas sp.]|jgi:hypothetical protein|nr:hypothetical protein [Sulfurimonadaceae bacterium]
MLKQLYGSLLLLLYFAKIPIFFGVLLLYALTPFELNLVVAFFWVVSALALIYDVVKLFKKSS